MRAMRQTVSLFPTIPSPRPRVAFGRRLAGLVASALLMLQGSVGFSQDPFEDLRIRIERLEQENRDLKSSMDSRTATASFETDIPPAPESDYADPNELDAEETEEDKHVGSLVEKYLRRRSRQMSPGDSAQDSKISALDGKMAGLLDRLNKKTFPTAVINGSMQADTGYYHQDANSRATYGPLINGADIRRARLGVRGALTENVNYCWQMDFGFFGRPTFTDIWVEQTNIPYLGKVRIGQWKQPFSLEVVSSYRYTTFMERSSLFQAFTAFRHLGVGFYDNADDLSTTWAGSVFATGQDQFGGSLFQNSAGTINNVGGVGTAERVTWVPYWDECTNGSNYLHLGAGHFFNAPPGQTVNFRSIPEFYIGQNANGVVGTSGQAAPGGFNGTPFFVQTGNRSVNYYNILGTELLYVNGPFSLQSEAMVNFVSQNGTTATLPGTYAQAGYFLTGEHRPYDRKLGQIDRVMPLRNFSFTRDGCNTGIGAWEIAARFSYLDLNDKAIQGGTLTDYTAGVNWYLNPQVKLVMNYIHSSSNYGGLNGAGVPLPSRRNETDMIAARCQMDF
jgi:phosphate-selective porin OprO/OprP